MLSIVGCLFLFPFYCFPFLSGSFLFALWLLTSRRRKGLNSKLVMLKFRQIFSGRKLSFLLIHWGVFRCFSQKIVLYFPDVYFSVHVIFFRWNDLNYCWPLDWAWIVVKNWNWSRLVLRPNKKVNVEVKWRKKDFFSFDIRLINYKNTYDFKIALIIWLDWMGSIFFCLETPKICHLSFHSADINYRLHQLIDKSRLWIGRQPQPFFIIAEKTFV